ncbi:MAG: carboxypeptidase regulatory-like domain-containing protein [Prolixibacteraceae bacterium]|nr:carboxypeptidase regulatory-like domain-containing protein [Prolixibacteraceae bacterium]
MRTLNLLVIIIFTSIVSSAQNQSPGTSPGQQITNYFSYNPRAKVLIRTDKSLYKPGETIWFRALVTDENNQLSANENSTLNVKLYDKKGTPLLQEIFRLNHGSTPGDLQIPEDLKKGIYFLAAYVSSSNSTEDLSYTPLKIDPEHNHQWVAETVLKDSISTSGQTNELFVILRDISGNAQKNTQLKYQFMNGAEIIEKGKLKTDEKGRATIPLTLPLKSNGEPFICTLSDSRDDWTHDVFLPTDLDQLIIRLYPEGGNLITGVPAKIGFTAFNKWGLPVDVEGSVINREGAPVTLVKTITKGLGFFSVANESKQTYKLVLSGKTGHKQSFEIPVPNPEGLAFSVTKTDTGFVSANLIFPDRQKHSIILTATQGNAMHWSANMEIDAIGRIKIPVKNLPQGIILLSVFSKDGNLLAERLIFQNKRQEVKVDVQAQKSSLKPNENMRVSVRLTDENNQPISGNLIVSVTDKFRNSINTPEINEYLQLESELETPGSLIPNAFSPPSGNAALMDIYLISNNLKAFDWNKIRQFKPESPTDINARSGRISGFVTDKNGNRINKAKVSLVNNKTMRLHTTTTNSEGIFLFPNLNQANLDDFSAKATDPAGKHGLKVVLSKSFEDRIPGFIAEIAPRYCFVNTDQVADDTYFRNNPDLFTREPRQSKPNTTSADNQRRLLSTSTNLLDVIKTIKPYRIMNNQIVFVGSENSLNHQGGALIVLDGQQLGTDISVIQSMSPSEIDHINISTNPMDIQRYTGLNSVGIIEIFQKKAKVPNPDNKQDTANRYDGEYRIPGEFPKEPANPKRDTRTTLLWIPDQEVDETGTFEFSVTAGKVLSDFIIKVEYMSENGTAGSGKTEFTVSK